MVNPNAVANMAILELDVSDNDSLLNMTTGSSEYASPPPPRGGGPASDDDDTTVTLRSEDEEPSRSRSVTFGQNTSLWSMRPIPDNQQTQNAIDAARAAGLTRHGDLERRPTERIGNLSASERSESEVEEPVATAVAATDDQVLAPPPSLAVARDLKKTKGALKSSFRTRSETPVPAPARRPRLSTVSQQYDLDGDGVLIEEEQAMRDRDVRDRDTQRTTKGTPKTSGRPAPARRSTSSSRSDKLASLRLSRVSRKYDLDGDGVLDEIEQAMRDRDLNNDGQLDNREVYNIIQDQLKSQENYGLYRRAAMALTCLVFILALSNFGTSWASALLAKDTSADAESGVIHSKKTGEIVGLQGTSHLVEIEELSDYEFEQRRLLVDAEMAEDPDHPDHAHRRLGRNRNNDNACDCSKMAYDLGKVRERDLMRLTEKCDGARTVQMRRTWKNGDIMDTSVSVDYDTLCTPGTQVKKRGKKKNNKKKTKTKVIDSHVEFRTKGGDGKDKSITFHCKKGECYASGELIHQPTGHPCKIERDLAGASECEADLACYDPDDHLARRGAGICTELREYARRGQICDKSHGVNACEANYVCYPTGRGLNARISVGTVSTGICRSADRRANLDEFCGVALGDDACAGGLRCLAANGRKISRGIGLCRQFEEPPTVDKFAKRNKECNIDFGDKACDEVDHTCYPRDGDFFDTRRGRTRICQAVERKVSRGDVCKASYRDDACAAGYECLDEKGRAIGAGFGVCQNDGGGNAIVKFAKRNKACSIDFGLDACDGTDHACYPRNGGFFDAGRDRKRICQAVEPNVRLGGVCKASNNLGACAPGYECLDEKGRAIRTGFGVCAIRGGGSAVVKFAKRNEACSIDFGRDACEAHLACYTRNGDFFDTRGGRARICQAVGRRVGLGGVCNTVYRADACATGYECLDEKRRSIRAGYGVCAVGGSRTGDGGNGGCSGSGACLPAGASWAVDCTDTCSCAVGTCMRNCVQGSDRWFCY